MNAGNFNKKKAFNFGVGAVVGKSIFDAATKQNNTRPKPKPTQPVKKEKEMTEQELIELLNKKQLENERQEKIREATEIRKREEKEKEREKEIMIKNKNDNTNFDEIDKIKKLKERFKKIFDIFIFKFEYMDVDNIYLKFNNENNIKFKLDMVNDIFEFIMYNFIDYREINNYIYLYKKIYFSKDIILYIAPLYYGEFENKWINNHTSEGRIYGYTYEGHILKSLSTYVNESLENIIFKEKLDMEKKEYLEYTKLKEGEYYDSNYTKMIIFSDINQEIIYDNTCILISYDDNECLLSLLEFNCLIKFLKEKKLIISGENFIIFGEIIHKKKHNIFIKHKFTLSTNEFFISDLVKENKNHDTIITYTSDPELYEQNIFLTDKKVIMDTLNDNLKNFSKGFFNKFKSFFGFSGGYAERYSERYSEKYLNNDVYNIKNEEYKKKYLKYKQKYLDLKKNM